MKRTETVNTFENGMVLDLNPISTPNNVLTNCLNGTLITFNGNEGVLQNDMGNGRVETAFLPEGYIPLGTTQLGGIIYIVSYNPLIDKCQIGSFPSPERNITTDELNKVNNLDDIPKFSIYTNKFFEQDDEGNITNLIKSPYQKLILFDKVLHPGDKFQIYCEDLAIPNNTSFLSAYGSDNANANKLPRYLKFNVVAIQDNGQITNLNDTLVWNNDYYILNKAITKDNGKLSLDEYRALVGSNYNVFNSKVDGKLAILAELECINSFDVSWDAKKNDNGDWDFYFFLNWTYDNDISKDKINLHSIKVNYTGQDKEKDDGIRVLEDYPNKKRIPSTDILYNKDGLTNQDNIFYTPYYVPDIDSKPTYNGEDDEDNEDKINGGITTPRKNDGTDNQFLLYNPITIENPAENASKIVDFTIYPGMPFGYLDYLKQTFSVDLSKLGTGDITLKEYRYWYDNDTNNITLNWALDAYPERGKSIKSVSFNTIEFNKNILDWLNSSNNGVKVDTRRAIKKINEQFKWENEENTAKDFNNLNPHPTSSKSSYSGHFTETITDLNANKLYLVCIDIDYNGEKTIRYYRFLYTSDIFNSKYFKKNDFSEIILDKQLEINYPSTIELTNEDRKEILKDKSNQEVTNIPSMLDLDVIEQNVSYHIDTEYTYNINVKSEAISNNKTFKVKLKGTQDPIYPDKIKATDNSEAQYLNSSQISGSPDEFKSITSTSKLSEDKKKFTQTLSTPLAVNYLDLVNIPVPYELQELNILTQWLLVWGLRNSINLYIADSYKDTSGISDDNKEVYDDDSHIYGQLSSYSKIYKQIQEKLKSFDIVALRFSTHHSSIAGGEGVYTFWGAGEREGRDSAYFTQSIQYNSENESGNVYLPIYAILDNKGEVKLFTFSKNYNPYSEVSTWYNSSTVKGINTEHRFNNNYTKPIGLNISNKDNVIEAPFKKYYKVIDSSSSNPMYSWNKIIYYNNYTWSVPISIEYTGIIEIRINDVPVKAANVLPKLPNNLQYNEQKKFTVTGSISKQENFDKYLDMIIYNKSSQTLVKSGNTVVSIDSVSKKNLYDNKGNQIEVLMKDRGDASAELSSLTKSPHKINVVDNKLVVKSEGVPSNENLKVMGRQQEQHIAISDIIKL